MKEANIFVHSLFAGTLIENEEGFIFQYDKNFLQSENAEAINLTMPLQEKPYNRCCYTLTPAYDMLSTTLVMPEDTEELALTLNGKKKKLKRSDFETAMSKSGLDAKVIENIFSKFEKALPKWLEFIDRSFLSEEMKGKYKELIDLALKKLK